MKFPAQGYGLEFSWPIGRTKEALPELGGCVASSPRSCLSDTIKSIATLVEEQNILEAKVGLTVGVRAFLLLYMSIEGCVFNLSFTYNVFL
ncbi:hypothetical protein LguiA_026220 [Lonicera macranthoides]